MKAVITSELAIEATLSAMSNASVAVFGDFCVDAYWNLDTISTELSVETGLPVRRVRSQSYGLGGAGNVVSNLAALGVQKISAVGVIGGDIFGRMLIDLLRARSVNVGGMIDLGAHWQTMVYAKPCRGGVEESRIDFGAFNTLNAEAIDRLVYALDRAAAESDVVILNQQIPAGVTSPEMIGQINRIIAANPKTEFIVDARQRAHLFEGAILKLNTAEAAHMLGEESNADRSEKSARQLATQLRQRTGKPVFLTRGERGMLVADESGIEAVRGIQILEAVDPVGAGDTVVAALAATLGGGGSALAAATVANLAASVTVRKLQTTGVATPDEIRHAAAHADYIYAPDLAEEIRFARYIPDTEIEAVEPLPDHLQIQHAIFDHDGTLSTLRQGWEQIMEPMMCRAILGERFADIDPSAYEKVIETSRDFIDKTTGIQTLAQMQGLAALVKRFGYVPAEKILDEHGYKAVYNEALLEMVRERAAKLQNGELDSIDFQIKNARPLLDALHRRGVKLYLASGTDVHDVIAEAEAMGYAHLFEGRIFGAVGDVNVEAKRMVLERIIKENNLSGHQFATFGDGPVEIRATRKRGGICIGVASDEVRRFGMNRSKRTRLIRAGAMLVVPDFSQLKALLGVLQLN